MPSIKLTVPAVEKLATRKTREDYWDKLLPGFGLRVSKTGRKTWVIFPRVLIQGKWEKKWFNLDTYPTLDLVAARNMAREALAVASDGGDPMTVIKPKVIETRIQESRDSFASVRDDFMVKYRTRKRTKPRPGTLEQMRFVFESDRLKSWKNRPLTEITKRDVLDVLDSLMDEGLESRANTFLNYIRMLFNWAVDRDIIESAPTDRIKPPGQAISRERVLTFDELKTVWEASFPNQERECGVHGHIVRVLMLTGQRRSEVAGMLWSELDLEEKTWEIPASRTKNKLPHIVPLPDPVIGIILEQQDIQAKIGKSAFVFTCTGKPFSGWSRSKQRLDGRANIPGWRLHDLRRTMVTGMNEMGIQPHIVEAIVNHISGHRAGVAGVYNRALYLDERRRALNAWALHVLELSKIRNLEMLF